VLKATYLLVPLLAIAATYLLLERRRIGFAVLAVAVALATGAVLIGHADRPEPATVDGTVGST
jgi:peptidoglycan/LPS O-acetylase OafA/YrhL